MKSLAISATLSLPLDCVTMTAVILARKGSGKTYTAAVLTEEMLSAGQQVVILDPVGVWWGLRSSADGKQAGFSIAVLGGDRSDIALEPSSGAIVADAVVEHGFACILDLSLMTKGETARFAAAFLETLYRRNRNPMHLIVDEADAFAPQRTFGVDDAKTLGAMQSIVRRGRARGVGVTMITQRPQVLNKDVLTQADVLVALRLGHPKDIDAIEEWVNVHADPREAKAMVQSLPDLPTGTAWVWAPMLKIFDRVMIRRRTTFDSSATPKPGRQAAKPKVLAPVDFAQLGERIASTVAEQKANSPEVLKARIRDLETELTKKLPAGEHIDPKRLIMAQKDEIGRIIKTVIKPQIDKAIGGQLDRLVERLREIVNEAVSLIKKNRAVLAGDEGWDLNFISGEAEHAILAAIQPGPAPAVPAPRYTTSTGKIARISDRAELNPPGSSANGKQKLRSGAERMLACLAQWYPHGRTEAQVAAQIQMKRTGGTFSTYKSDLRTRGYMEQKEGLYSATEQGLAYFGGSPPPPTPRTTQEMRDLWEPKLRSGAVKILDALIRESGRPMKRSTLGVAVGMEPSGGTFSTYLSDLRTAGLVLTQDGEVWANSETLFLGEQP